jgi:hypothetical protein
VVRRKAASRVVRMIAREDNMAVRIAFSRRNRRFRGFNGGVLWPHDCSVALCGHATFLYGRHNRHLPLRSQNAHLAIAIRKDWHLYNPSLARDHDVRHRSATPECSQRISHDLSYIIDPRTSDAANCNSITLPMAGNA